MPSDRILPSAADALGILRMAAAVVLPAALLHAAARPGLPILLFAVAAASDYVDGGLARRGRGATRHGAVLDNVADIAFVLAATCTGAHLGLVPGAAPLAIAVAFAAYALASLTGSARGGTWRMARSALGHAAGVVNYALAGLVVGAAAIPGRAWTPLLRLGAAVTIGLNLTAVLERLVSPLLARARAPRGAGRLARSGRSSA